MKNISDLLNELYKKYATPDFIENDPISIPHSFNKKEDIEISAFLTATIAWGNRKSILKSANMLMKIMDNAPFDFVINHTNKDLYKIKGFIYRTFNSNDCVFFIQSLNKIYKNSNLENIFSESYKKNNSIKYAINTFREAFFSLPHESRTEKHIANVSKDSAAKKINMFLRWMVRPNTEGIDFGLWKEIDTSDLKIPLDVHSGNIARKLDLLTRKQNDWKAVEELTSNLKKISKNDPVKYDYALFGAGVNNAELVDINNHINKY